MKKLVALTGALAAVGCAPPDNMDFPFETYEAHAGPSSAAAIDGTLKLEGSCLYVDTGTIDAALLLPSTATWNADTETLTIARKQYRVGEAVTFGGQLANEPMNLRCSGEEIFVVG